MKMNCSKTAPYIHLESLLPHCIPQMDRVNSRNGAGHDEIGILFLLARLHIV